MNHNVAFLAAAAGLALITGCSSGGGGATGGGSSSSSSSGNTGSTSSTTSSSTTSTTSSTSSGGLSPAAIAVEPCFAQNVAPGITVQDLLSRDTLRLDLTKPNGFPNGRQLQDPVIDLTLAYLFTDLTKNSLDALAKLAINPPTNADTLDAAGAVVPFTSTFPFVVAPHGPLKPEGVGSGFSFRTNAVSDYDVIDAMGNPAVGTILLQFSIQPGYNADQPSAYVTNGGKYINDMKETLGFLSAALKDDFQRLSFTPCGR